MALYLNILTFTSLGGDRNNISKTFRQLNCDISITAVLPSLCFSFHPSQMLPSFPAPGQAEQSQAHSKTIGFPLSVAVPATHG